MTDKQIMLDGVDVLKEKINMCFILLLNKLETSETIEQTIYEHLDVFVEEWNKQLKAKEQECEELKLQYKELGQCSEKLKDYYDKEKETLSNRFLELKQTLTEIKEIAEGVRNYLQVPASKDVRYEMDIILQKISECEVE